MARPSSLEGGGTSRGDTPPRLRRGGNPDPLDFLLQLNPVVVGVYPEAQTIAEESPAWPMVSRPTYVGGLGFGMKWDMGWMHDTLAYFEKDPIHRRYHQNYLTFRGLYAFSESFVLPLSHDAVSYTHLTLPTSDLV